MTPPDSGRHLETLSSSYELVGRTVTSILESAEKEAERIIRDALHRHGSVRVDDLTAWANECLEAEERFRSATQRLRNALESDTTLSRRPVQDLDPSRNLALENQVSDIPAIQSPEYSVPTEDHIEVHQKPSVGEEPAAPTALATEIASPSPSQEQLFNRPAAATEIESPDSAEQQMHKPSVAVTEKHVDPAAATQKADSSHVGTDDGIAANSERTFWRVGLEVVLVGVAVVAAVILLMLLIPY